MYLKITEEHWMSADGFIQRAKVIHGDKYDYSKVEYINTKTSVIIICPTHGEFEQAAYNHTRGYGCPSCRGLPLEAFIQRAKSVHGDKYDYSKVVYKNVYSKVIIICKKHGEFEQAAYNHTRGYGCPICAKSKLHEGANTFYIWQEADSNRYKIGITSKSLQVRMTDVSRKLNITPIPILELKIDDAFSLEQSLLQIFAEDVYDGEGYGVEFLTLTDEKLSKLLHLVKQVSKNGLPEHLKLY